MRKLTEKQKEERTLKKILKRIKVLEKKYCIDLIKRACFRYYQQRSEEKKIKREIKEKENQLKELKKRVSR